MPIFLKNYCGKSYEQYIPFRKFKKKCLEKIKIKLKFLSKVYGERTLENYTI